MGHGKGDIVSAGQKLFLVHVPPVFETRELQSELKEGLKKIIEMSAT